MQHQPNANTTSSTPLASAGRNQMKMYRSRVSTILNLSLKACRAFSIPPELNVSAIARKAGIGQSLFAQYLNGTKKPSEKRKNEILQAVRHIGTELQNATFKNAAFCNTSRRTQPSPPTGRITMILPMNRTIIVLHIFFSLFRDMHHIGVVLSCNSHI